MMFGIDISNYQKNLDLSSFDFDFALIKATEGKSNVSPSFVNQITQCREMRKMVGCYHYARPDLDNTIPKMEEEADHFTETVFKYAKEKETVLVLDWEQEPTNQYTLCAAFLERVYLNTGVMPFVYASKSVLTGNIAFFERFPIWMASWPTISDIEWHASNEWIEKYSTKNIPWKIWQYTSNGKVPGYSGRIDFDYTPMLRAEWLVMAGADIKIDYGEKLTDDMKWAINNGLFTGYSDGTFKPTEPLTRQAAATILRRFYNIIMN